MSKSLKNGLLNCQGIKGKFDQTPEFQNLISEDDIFGVCETWLSDWNDNVNIPGFKLLSSYYSNRKQFKGTYDKEEASIKAILRKHESEKKHQYNRGVMEVECRWWFLNNHMFYSLTGQ